MLTKMDLQGTELQVTICGNCEFSTAQACIQKLNKMGPLRIESLHVTLNDIKDASTCAIGLLLWMKDKTRASQANLRLSNCSNDLSDIFHLTEVVEQYAYTQQGMGTRTK